MSSYTHTAPEKRKALQQLYSILTNSSRSSKQQLGFCTKVLPPLQNCWLTKILYSLSLLINNVIQHFPLSPSLQPFPPFPLAWSSFKSSATVQIISPILEGAALNSKSSQTAKAWSFLLSTAHSPLIPASSVTLILPCPLILFSISA